MSGDKKSALMPTRLLAQGFAIASLNYHLSGDALAPALILDCKATVRWLRAHAGQYGIDSTRFIAWGESAGAHLATLLGTAGRTRSFDVGGNLRHSSAVQGVVDLYGPTDFLQMDAQRMPDGARHAPADSPNRGSLAVPSRTTKRKCGWSIRLATSPTKRRPASSGAFRGHIAFTVHRIKRGEWRWQFLDETLLQKKPRPVPLLLPEEA